MLHRPKQEYSWRAPRFLYKKKTPLWYTNVSIFFFIVFVALLFLQNYLGMVVVAVAFWYFLNQANHRPHTVDYTINELGIHIDETRIPFETLESFCVETFGNYSVIVVDPIEPLNFPTTLVAKNPDLEPVVELLLRHLPQKPRMPLLVRLTHYLHY